MWTKSHFPRQKLKRSDQKLDHGEVSHVQMFSLPLSAVFGSTTADNLLGKYCLVLKSGFLCCKFNLPSICGKVPLESISF